MAQQVSGTPGMSTGTLILEHGLLTPSYPKTHRSLQVLRLQMASRVSCGSTSAPLVSHTCARNRAKQDAHFFTEPDHNTISGKEALLSSFYVRGI